ncbi:MAG: LPS assembly lipoprotein LptE [Geminicoccaceae bacterium]
MSWSEARRHFLLTGLLGLGACGLQPIYGRSEARKVVPVLASIDVTQLYGRRGQYLRSYLLDELNPEGVRLSPEYQLDITLRQESNALAIQLDNTPTRANLALGAAFTLRRRADGAVVFDSAVRRVVSYNIRSDPFATLITEQDAERRAAKEVARQIRTQLSLYFAQQTA